MHWKRFWKSVWGKVVPIAVCLALLGTFIGLRLDVAVRVKDGGVSTVGIGFPVLRVGTVEAAGTADYVCDGVDDDVQIQAALNALPSGGKLVILTGNYVFAATVTRLIDNVQIEGVGQATYISHDGATPLFAAGGDYWVFRDFKTDAGGVTFAATTGYILENVLLGTTYYGFTTQSGAVTGGQGTFTTANITTLNGGTVNGSQGTFTTGNFTTVNGTLNGNAAGSQSTYTTANFTTLNAPSGRSATYVIADSDSPAQVKAQADVVCDGVADEVQIQAAIEALPHSGGSIKLFGHFVLSAPLTPATWQSAYALVKIEGEGIGGGGIGGGPTTRIALANGANCNIFNDNGTHGLMEFDSIYFDGNKTNQAGGTYAINLTAANVRLFDVIVVNSYDCAIGGVGGVLTGSWISIGGSGGRALYRNGVYSDRVDQLWVSNCSVAGTQYPVKFITVNDSSFTHVTVDVCASTYGGAVEIYQCNRSTFQFDYIGGNQGEGIDISGTTGCIISIASMIDNVQNAGTTWKTNMVLDGDIGNVITIGYAQKGSGNSTSDILFLNAANKNNVVMGRVERAVAPYLSNSLSNNTILLDGYIAPGQIKTASGGLTAGANNTITLAWHNPESRDIFIKKVVLEITTGSVTAGSVIDIGIADNATGANRGTEFFDDLDANDVDINDSWVTGDNGTQTKWVFCQDSASATDGWIVGQILVADAAALVGRYYIEYVGR